MKFQLSAMIGLCVLTTAAPVVKTIDARDPSTEDFQQAGHMDKRDPDWPDDILKVITKEEPLVAPLITAPSTEPGESLEKRNLLDDILKVINEKKPIVKPLITARSIEPEEESLTKRIPLPEPDIPKMPDITKILKTIIKNGS